MSRVFAYCRVSTTDQTTQNQSIEIKAAGFAIEAQRLIEESISGSVGAKERPGFTNNWLRVLIGIDIGTERQARN
jgi:putative DNA-invertase from lambdoid prophage Rac